MFEKRQIMTDKKGDHLRRPPEVPVNERESAAESADSVDGLPDGNIETEIPGPETIREEIMLAPVLPITGRPLHTDKSLDVTSQNQATVAYSEASYEEAIIASQSPSSEPRIDGYQVQQLVGRGGMGVVYRAVDLQLSRTVAIKLLPSIRNTPRARTRFESEARLLAQVDHPGVARIFRIGTTGENPYIAMEFVEGQSLDRLAAGKPLEPRVAAEYVRQLAEALQACHDLGIIHRDVKPGNALITPNRTLKLTDFGLAKLTSEDAEHLTRTGEIVGTPSYMAPEQASGMVREFGPQTDVYGAGAVLYELLTGRPPFAAPDAMQTLFLILNDPPLSPRDLLLQISPDLETIALKCLEKQKHHRYASAQELADDLDRYLRGEPIRAKPVSAIRKSISWIRRHPAISSVVGLCMVAVVGTIWGISAHNIALRRELDRSHRLAAEGRNLSRWLLTDFSRVLENDEGLTFVRNSLAQRTQQYLDAIQQEMTDDQAVKLALAESLIRLAELQGAPGAGSLGLAAPAKENLAKAQQLLSGLKGTGLQTSILEVLASLNLAALEMDSSGSPFDPTRHFQTARNILENQGNEIEPVERNQLKLELLSLELQYANQSGNQSESDRLIEELDRLGQTMLATEDELEHYVKIFSTIARARYYRLDQQSRSGEIISFLEQGLETIDRLAKNQPSSLSVEFQIAAIHNLLGQAYFRAEQFADAKTHFHRVVDYREAFLRQDQKNHGASFNLAQAWQSLGETAMQEGDLDSSGEYFQRAAKLFQEYAERTGQSVASHPDTLDIFTTLSVWHRQRGEFDEARREIQKVIQGLEPYLDRSWELRLRQADAMVQLTAIEMIDYAEQSTLASDQDAAEPGVTVSPDLSVAYQRAVDQAQASIKCFEAIQADKELPEQAAGQLERTRMMLKFIEEDFAEKFGPK